MHASAVRWAGVLQAVHRATGEQVPCRDEIALTDDRFKAFVSIREGHILPLQEGDEPVPASMRPPASLCRMKVVATSASTARQSCRLTASTNATTTPLGGFPGESGIRSSVDGAITIFSLKVVQGQGLPKYARCSH